MKHVRLFLLVLGCGCLTGCLGPGFEGLFKDKAVTVQAPSVQQERWCYRTLGRIDCYTEPQAFSASRLVGVYPMDKTPADSEAHKKALATVQQDKKQAKP